MAGSASGVVKINTETTINVMQKGKNELRENHSRKQRQNEKAREHETENL